MLIYLENSCQTRFLKHLWCVCHKIPPKGLDGFYVFLCISNKYSVGLIVRRKLLFLPLNKTIAHTHL